MIPRVRATDYESRVGLAAVILATILAGVVGGLLVLQPLAALAVAGLIVCAILLHQADRLDVYFLVALGFILIGYAFIGRGFAYLGAPPVFIGEVVVGLAVLALFVNLRRWRVGIVEGLLLLFMIVGALATIPYLGIHGADALRDAVIWGYGLIALAVACMVRREHFEIVQRWYGSILPWFLAWVPVAMIAGSVLTQVPSLPGSSVSLLPPKGGDLGVQLAGVAAFLLVGLWSRRSEVRSLLELAIWPLWMVSIVVAGSINRGGLLAAIVASSAVLMLSPSRKLLTAAFAGLLLVSSVIWIDPTVDLGRERELSIDQVRTNLVSLVSDSGVEGLEGTREWRTRWWESIVDYTVRGEYFWTGKGFGVNLAQSDGFTLPGDPGLRSPHNGHMSVLARMGVPGMAVWVVLQAAFAITMLNAILRTRRARNTFWTSMLIVIFAYWLAMLVNASFDVYLEGPQGGIWFWSVFGLGLAAARLSADTGADSEREESVESTGGNRPTPPLKSSRISRHRNTVNS